MSLKKKESRLVWQVLMRGILITDRMIKGATAAEQDAYRVLRPRIIRAWKSGLILGGVRPKSKIYDIMPKRLLQDIELAALKKISRRDAVKAKRHIVVPKKRTSA